MSRRKEHGDDVSMIELRTDDAEACWIFLLRHGATASNVARPPRLQGRGINLGLSDEGRAQAAAAARLLADARLSAIYTSPLLRAVETAEEIGRHQSGASIRVVRELVEVDVGAWEGRTWADVQRDEPEYCAAFLADPATVAYRGGESLADVRSRVVPALTTLAQEHPGQSIAVVAHNVVNRCFLAELLDIPLRRARELTQENCGVNLVRWKRERWKLVTMNSVMHLNWAAP